MPVSPTPLRIDTLTNEHTIYFEKDTSMTDNISPAGRKSWWKQEPRRRRQRLRPTLTALEGRTLLSVFMVENTLDDGSTGSLRGAIAAANAFPGADLIEFSPTVFSTPQTINLTLGELKLTDPAGITIQGTGANLVTIDGNHLSRVLEVASGVTADISGLTITGGTDVPGSGGGGLLNNGTASIPDARVGNTVGAVAVSSTLANGTPTLSGCTISDNNTGTRRRGLCSRRHHADRLHDQRQQRPPGGRADLTSGASSRRGCTISGNSSVRRRRPLYPFRLTLDEPHDRERQHRELRRRGMHERYRVDLDRYDQRQRRLDEGRRSVSNYCTATLTDCTISGNSSAGTGAAIDHRAPSTTPR